MGCYEQGIEDDEVRFFTNISSAIARHFCCAGVAIKCCYHHPRLYFLDAMFKKKRRDTFCANFSSGLNAAMKDCHYPFPSPEDIFAKLNGGKFFSKIGLSGAYLQSPVEEESSKLLCINMHRRLYKF